MRITLERRFYAAHLYEQKAWSTQKNQEVFGLCYSKYGHGHNYRWQAEVECTQADLCRSSLAEEMNRICALLDHKHLNFDLPEVFTERIPTTENIALFLFESLAKVGVPFKVKRIRLYEDNDLWSEIVN